METTDVNRLDALIPGEWIENELGRCFVAVRTYDGGHSHGPSRLREFLTVSVESLSALGRDPELVQADVSSALFLDLETTGLDRNDNTLVFLVGVGFFCGDRFHIRQYFLDYPGNERPMLLAVRQLLAGHSLLVTFNGKGFDVPMLAGRFALNGIECGLSNFRHLDMLPPARRLWRERLESCRLTSLEANILGLRRTDDVRGDLIPGIYRRYCSDGDPVPLLRVFHHNRQDILTLLGITSVASAVFHDPFSGRVYSPEDFFSLGRLYEAVGDHDRAVRAYRRALSQSLCGPARHEACRRLLPLLRQTERPVHLLEAMVSSDEDYGVYPFVELAKHYEHELNDLERAERMALIALEKLPHDRCTRTTQRELEKRLERIRHKLVQRGGR